MLQKHKYLIDQISLEWIEVIFQDLESDMELEEFIDTAEDQGVAFGKRRDVFNRLIDLKILEKYTENRTVFLRWTEFGEQLKEYVYSNRTKISYLMHLLQITEAFNTTAKRYFTTYYIITDILMQSKNNRGHSEVFAELYNRLNDLFPDDDIEGIEKSTIAKSVVFLKEILDEDYNELQFVDPILMAYGIQRYIEMKTGNRNGKVLITEKERKELSNVLLINRAHFKQHLDKSNKYTKAFELRYSTAGIIITALKKIEL